MKNIVILMLAFLTFVQYGTAGNKENKFIKDNIVFAKKQIDKEISVINKSGKFINPVTLDKKGNIFYCDYSDWRSGFFPGSVWYLYELTGQPIYRTLADKYTWSIETAKDLTWHHDIGFIINCSFGNALRLTKDPSYKKVIITAAKSLITRFRPVAGVIQSWNVNKGWQSERGWQCPVIIDNMMNLELLFKATELSGDSTFYKIAVSHANRTLEEHFRKDGSCYHVIDYDLKTGEVRHRQTAQGYSDESAWSRGQAWAIYGFTMCYEKTGQKKYLDQALKTFNFMKNHVRMPVDCIPYWDMDAPNIPNEPRDASSASCIASALYKMCLLQLPNSEKYKEYADKIMNSLASSKYRAKLGTNGNFLLMHSVGSKPHNSEVDVPLNYADYYFLEALSLKKRIEANK